MPDGSLLVATGTQGKLFQVSGAASGKVLYDSDDTHIRAVAVHSERQILLGTAGQGLLLELGQGGAVRTLHDAAQPEIVALTSSPDGNRYVAALAAEASFVDLSAKSESSESSEEEKGEEEGGETVVVVADGTAPPTGSRRAGFKGPRSEVLRISPGGSVETVWRFEDETVYSMLWHRDRLWVGTGLEGKLYSYRGNEMVLEKDIDERQIVVLLEDTPGPAFATTNAAALYRMTGGTERRGEYTSAVLDASQVSRLGTLHWDGELPPGTRVEMAVRSGSSAEPDRTWSPWSEPREGREIALDVVPRGRYLQWRATLVSADGRSPRITGVEISYLQENLKPEIESLSVLEPGQILVPANFNPASQVYEPAHPNRDGIFTTLKAADENRSEGGRLKPLWKLGYRTLRWAAKDPNEDPLRYRLSLRRDGSPESWIDIAEELTETYYSFDATVLPDGRYRFRLMASDVKGNLSGESLEAERVSEAVVIDHAAPRLQSVKRSGRGLVVSVADELSPLREARISIDAGEWQPVKVADGLLDGRQEELHVELPAAAKLLLLRLGDSAWNSVAIDLTEHLP
jgi:hypothetical protein